MKLRTAPIILALAGIFIAGQASAQETRVPRIKPTSAIKKYPFGVLREDYTPYGMPGVADRDYFDRIESDRTVLRVRY